MFTVGLAEMVVVLVGSLVILGPDRIVAIPYVFREVLSTLRPALPKVVAKATTPVPIPVHSPRQARKR